MPCIGIFWAYRGKILGRAVDFSVGEQGVPGLFDSQDNHADLWEKDPKLLVEFPWLKKLEYFAVPRGRVLWSVTEQMAIIYVDEKLLGQNMKREIAIFFDLEQVKIEWRTDSHYSTGP